MATKKYTRKSAKNLKLADILTILEDVIEVYMAEGSNLSFNMLLLKRGITPTQLQYWKNKYEEVNSLILELRDIRKIRYEDVLLNGGGGNPTNLVWYGKTHLGLIPAEISAKIDGDKSVAELNQTIEIGFVTDEDED